MSGISFGGGASVNVGGHSFSAGGTASVDTAALAALGQAAVDTVTDLGSKAAGKAGDAASYIQGRAGDAVDAISSKSTEAFGAAAKWLAKVPGHLPSVDLSKLSLKMALPNFPPPPDIKLALRADIHVRLEAEIGVKNGGWPKLPFTIGEVKPDGNFTLITGTVPPGTRMEVSDLLKAAMSCVGTGAVGLAKLGIDLAAACARNPILSQLLAKLPQGLAVLMDARRAVQGGFKHFVGAMIDLFKDIVSNFRIRTGGTERPEEARPPDATTMIPDGPGSTKQPSGDTKAPTAEQAAEASILDNPHLSFEDKLFYFCLKMAKEGEDKMNKMMKDWEICKKAAKAQGAAPAAGTPGTSGSAPAAPGAGAPDSQGAMPGLPGGPGGAGGGGLFPEGAGSQVGNMVGMAQNIGSGILGIAATTAPLWVPALTALAGTCCAAIPGVGPAIGTAITAIGAPTMTLIVGGVLGAAAAGLKAVPLAQMAQQAVTGMEKKKGRGSSTAAQAQQGAEAQGAPMGLGKLMLDDNEKKGALIGGLVGLAAGPVFGPLFAGPGAMLGAAIAGIMGGGIDKEGAMKGALIGGGVGLAAGPLFGPLLAPIFGAAGAYIGGKMNKKDGPAAAGAAPSTAATPGAGPAPGTGGTAPTDGTREGETPNADNPATTITLSDGTTINAADKDSETMFQQKLTYFQQQMTKMYEMIGTLMKSFHDTQMSSIRNMK